jgi:predicted NUDIX family phosphoesterase
MSEVEHVLVTPTENFHRLGHFQGFSTDVARYIPALFEAPGLAYRPRPEMEADPSFKQFIPYVVFRYRDAEGNLHLFQYTRGKGQGEARLHAKRSIGVGGHISSVDAASGNAYDEGMRRELAEEVAIGAPYTSTVAGLINDDLTEVGRVHLGVVHLCDIAAPEVAPREDDLAFSGFRPVSELLSEIDRFETWSQICLKALFSE